jgi:hypothetical protein
VGIIDHDMCLESLLVYGDEHQAFMRMASPTTVADLRRDPRIEVNRGGLPQTPRAGRKSTGCAGRAFPAR